MEKMNFQSRERKYRVSRKKRPHKCPEKKAPEGNDKNIDLETPLFVAPIAHKSAQKKGIKKEAPVKRQEKGG